MLSYLHHRFNPDLQQLEVLDCRNLTVREDNRIIQLGSKLGNHVSEDPYGLPDTILSRQLAVRKHYPPHHPRLINYLFQMGCFSHISKLIKELGKWMENKEELDELYNRIGP